MTIIKPGDPEAAEANMKPKISSIQIGRMQIARAAEKQFMRENADWNGTRINAGRKYDQHDMIKVYGIFRIFYSMVKGRSEGRPIP